MAEKPPISTTALTEKPKAEAMISLSGLKTLVSGKTKQTNYFDFLDIDLDDYSHITYTQSQALQIKRQFQKLTTGATAAIPLFCGGANVCPFARNCPFVKADVEAKKNLPEGVKLKSVVPVGLHCLVETALLTTWTKIYLAEFEVEPNNFSEFQHVQQLAETELLLWRVNNNMAKLEHAELFQDSIVGVDTQGNPLTKREINTMFELHERLINRKSKLIKAMVGDREGKYKRAAALKTNSSIDASASAAELKTKLSKMIKEGEQLEKKLKLAEAIVVDGEYESDKCDTEPDVLTPDDLINQG